MELVTKEIEAVPKEYEKAKPKMIDINEIINNQFNQYQDRLYKDIKIMASKTKNGSIRKGYSNVINLLNIHKKIVNGDYAKFKAENERIKEAKTA